jgi:hypothetical protein
MATNRVFGVGARALGPKVAVGIDQSLTGFAFAAIDWFDPSIHYINVYKSPYNGVQRLSDIDSFLYEQFEILKGKEIVDIAMEGTVLASNSALVLGELSATVKLFFYEYFDKTNHVFPEPSEHLRTPLQIPPMTHLESNLRAKQQILLQSSSQ